MIDARLPGVESETIVECSGQDGLECTAGKWFHRMCVRPTPTVEEWAHAASSTYQCPSCRPRSRKRKPNTLDDTAHLDDDDVGNRGTRPSTFEEIPQLTRERALLRLLDVLGTEAFPPTTTNDVVALAKRWEKDIDNENHTDTEVRQWYLYRIRHLYDATTTQRLVTDPATATWIAAKRAAMDSG